MRKSNRIKILEQEVFILKANVERLEAMMASISGKKKNKDTEIESGKWYKDRQ